MKRRTKSNLYLLLVILALITITACGKTTGTAQSESNEAGNITKADEQKVKLTAVVAGLPEESPSGIALKRFAELVSEYSNGSVEVDTFFGADLGSLTAAVEGMVQGTIDIVSTGTSYFSGYVPEIQVFELPYVFATNEEARTVLDSEVGDEVGALFTDKGIVILSYWESGLRHVTNNKLPIVEPTDLKGLKIRTVVSTTQQKTWEAFGAIPMAIDMNEAFTAMQQGTVDGQENTLAQIVSARLYEVQNHLSLTNHAYTPMPFGISKKTWDKLSESQQSAVKKASEEARDYQRELDDKSDIENVAYLESKGVSVVKEPNREAFSALVQPVYDLFIESTGSDIYLKKVQEKVETLR